jgi:hypothetical protein
LDGQQARAGGLVVGETLHFLVTLGWTLTDADSIELNNKGNYWIVDVGVVQNGMIMSSIVSTNIAHTVIGQTHLYQFA